jgi:hypothetical protein
MGGWLIAYLSKVKRQTLFWLVTAATIGWMLVMRPVTPTNIIEFEFARTPEKAVEIFIDWGGSGAEKAKMSILLDFVFLVLYCWAISLGCKVAAGFSQTKIISKAGLKLSRIIWIAGVCDIIENVSLLLVMRNLNAMLLELAFWTAGIKFTIVIAALLFIIIAFGIGLTRKLLRSN